MNREKIRLLQVNWVLKDTEINGGDGKDDRCSRVYCSHLLEIQAHNHPRGAASVPRPCLMNVRIRPRKVKRCAQGYISSKCWSQYLNSVTPELCGIGCPSPPPKRAESCPRGRSLFLWCEHSYHLELLLERPSAFAPEYPSFLCTVGAFLNTCTPEAVSETCRDPPSVCNRLHPSLSFQCFL